MQILCNKKPLAVLIAAASGISGSAVAENDSVPVESDFLETVVVVGQATNAKITYEDVEAYQANNLADVFRLAPSISVGGGASGISQKIYIRGLEDSMINVTVDGSPQTSTLFHHIGRVTIDPDLLKEVEVQSGAGEATSGAGAIGGSVRFITKDVNDLLAEDKSFGAKIKTSYFSNNGEQYSASLYGRLSDDWGVLGYFSDIDRDNREGGDGVEMDGTSAKQSLGFVKLSGDITENQHLSLSFESREEEGEFTRWPNWSPLEGSPLYAGEGARDTFVANYQFTQSELINLEVSAYHTESSFQRDLWTWGAEITSYGFDIRNTSVVGEHRFSYGIDLREDEVESGEYDVSAAHLEEGDVLGVYFQAHSQVTEKLLLSYGARYDAYDFEQLLQNEDSAPLAKIDSSEISVNAGFEYSITDEWAFSLGYAEASRGKEVGDGFTTWGTYVDPDLEIEVVSNIEVALEYSVENFHAKIALFQSDIDDVIYDQSSRAVYYENVGTVETDGFEVEIAYRWNDQIDIQFGYASSTAQLDPAAGIYSVDYGKVDLEGYEHPGLGNSRGDTWNLGIRYSPIESLSFGWNMIYVEDLNNLEVLYRAVELSWISELQTIDKPGYTVHDLYAEWTPTNQLKLNLSVINALDDDYRDHSSVGDYSAIPTWESVSGYKEPGQDIRLSLTFNF